MIEMLKNAPNPYQGTVISPLFLSDKTPRVDSFEGDADY
jgi:hypothetical protein